MVHGMNKTSVSLAINGSQTQALCHGHLDMAWAQASMWGKALNESNAHDQMCDVGPKSL